MPPSCLFTPLPLRETLAMQRPMTAAAARTHVSHLSSHVPAKVSTTTLQSPSPSDIVAEYLTGKRDMAMVYMSPDSYFEAFKEVIDLRKFDLTQHRTAGLCLAHLDNRLFLGSMTSGTPGTKIPHWRSRLKGAWLIKVGNTLVSSIAEAQDAFMSAITSGSQLVTLLFSHPEICRDISHDGLPLVSSAPFSQHIHDQMNKRWDFTTVADYLQEAPPYKIMDDGDVLNYVTRVMKFTRGKLLQQNDWTDRQNSEYLQLNQYDAQGMFGTPVASSEEDAIFHLVWTYAIKAVDGCKKARCVCDGST